ncbi:asparagine synthase (glutamine-hydrolyzing) [Ornithinibacillus californiensis]|uniref:asparagine synthase (glutamine-hydrolyzing) n=1 Tax=Ornithinibacillus californiensis TaxID=161536 RepID=UPI00064DCE0F|nr:asparagine synthase (glutamine-hydrolyzing) [Ornithinibacillus californiensis]
MSGFYGVLKKNELEHSEEEIDDKDNPLQLFCLTENNQIEPRSFMESRFQVALYGDLYNERTLRATLENKGYQFEGDTAEEVLATLFLESGKEAFKLLRGMYAFVIWDAKDETLYAVRDPFGIKPFYYMETDEEIIFSTEKQIITELSPNLTLHEEALQHYFSFQYVPTPMTLAKEITSLEPGHFFIKQLPNPLQKHAYFQANFVPVDGNEQQIINRIQEVMIDSVKAHIQGEAAVGSLLSGGIDSSLIVALAKDVNPAIKTFSVGFEEEGYTEVPIAQQTALELGVENISYIIKPQEYVDILPTIVRYLGEPLADPSCVPLYFAAKLASEHTKVVLSGEGADELFGGYNIYREYQSLKFFHHLSPALLNGLHKLSRVIPIGWVGKSFLERGTTPLNERYIGNAKIFEEKEKQLFLKTYHPSNRYRNITEDLFQRVHDEHPTHQMQYVDIHTWLPGDILLKAEHMTKAHGIELRTPFLDKEVFDVASKIPVAYKIADKQTKVILRKAAMDFVPSDVVNRKKLGFPVPIRSWLKNELYDWAYETMQESETDCLLDKAYCLKLLTDHAKGSRDNARRVWTILMFMLWHQIFIENE